MIYRGKTWKILSKDMENSGKYMGNTKQIHGIDRKNNTGDIKEKPRKSLGTTKRKSRVNTGKIIFVYICVKPGQFLARYWRESEKVPWQCSNPDRWDGSSHPSSHRHSPGTLCHTKEQGGAALTEVQDSAE